MINASEILAARILIVDDMPVNVALLTQFLGNAGYLNVSATCDPFAARHAEVALRLSDPPTHRRRRCAGRGFSGAF